MHQVLEGGWGDSGDVGICDGEPVEVQTLETKRGDVLQVRPVIDVQTPKVGELAEILVLQGSDAEVAEVKSDEAAEIRQRLTRDGCQVAALYCELFQPYQSWECLGSTRNSSF